MTKLKKFTSVLISAAMVFSIGFAVFADDEAPKATITISEPSANSYSLYKIFDVVEDDDGNKTYYVSEDSEWYDEIIDDEDAPFEVGTVTDGVARVYLKADDPSEATPWIKARLGDKEDYTTSNIEDGKITFEDVEYGYYYITTTTGAVVIIDHVISDLPIADKSTVPSWDSKDPSDTTDSNKYGKFIADTTTPDEWGIWTDAGMGDIQYFMINAYVPMKNGSLSIYDYTITDVLDDGFSSIDNCEAYIYSLDSTETIPLNNGELVVDTDNNTITLNYVVSDYEDYPTDAHVRITYSAVVDTDAVIYKTTDGSEKVTNDNTATLEWTQYDSDLGEPTPDDPTGNVPTKPQKPVDPEDPSKGTEDDFPTPATTQTYVYGFSVLKIDAEDKDADNPEPLLGAKFNLYKKGTDDSKTLVKLVDNEDGTYRVATENDADDDTTTVITAGSAVICGFDITDTYELEEIEAPEGYNKLSESKDVEFAHEKTLEANNIVVENSKGITLPTTGGIGTRIFYITGATIMLGAIVVLVAKKRTSNK